MPKQQRKEQADHLLTDTGEQAEGLPPNPLLDEQEKRGAQRLSGEDNGILDRDKG